MGAERKNCLTAVKHLMKRLQNHLHQSRKLNVYEEFEVPEDVKEGHFAVVAKTEEEKPTRFVVELRVLKHPAFLRLLKMAEDEYGFHHRGAVQVPCQPDELRRIIQERIC
ncbi:hypothetical protein ACS0TY_015086 [Phlomoides rotata]